MGTAASRRITKREMRALHTRIDGFIAYGENPSSAPGMAANKGIDMQLLFDLQVSSLPRPKRLMMAALDKVRERYPDERLDDVFPEFARLDFKIQGTDGGLYAVLGTFTPSELRYIPPHHGGLATDEAPGHAAWATWAPRAYRQRWLTRVCGPVVKGVIEECSTYRQLAAVFTNIVPIFPSDVIDDLRAAKRASRLPHSATELSYAERQQCEGWLAQMRLLENHPFEQCPFVIVQVEAPPVEGGDTAPATDLTGLPE